MDLEHKLRQADKPMRGLVDDLINAAEIVVVYHDRGWLEANPGESTSIDRLRRTVKAISERLGIEVEV